MPEKFKPQMRGYFYWIGIVILWSPIIFYLGVLGVYEWIVNENAR
jgi:hypothetical protein